MKKKPHKGKGKKTLTAVGAVVAAGLAPGIISATPILAPADASAADAVAIDGMTYGFDELYAMQQPTDERRKKDPQVATRYGVPPSTVRPKQPATHYGVPRPKKPVVPAPAPTPAPAHVPAPTPAPARVGPTLNKIQLRLVTFCADLIDADYNGIFITLDSDLTRELGMTEDELKELQAEIEERYGVEVSYHRFYLKDQLNTLRLISEHIYKLKHVWD